MKIKCFRCGTKIEVRARVSTHYATLFGGKKVLNNGQIQVVGATQRNYCKKCWQEMISIYKAFRLMEETGEMDIDEDEIGREL